jgi:hypothetical protein
VGVLAPWRPPLRMVELGRNAEGPPEPIYIPFNHTVPQEIWLTGNNSGWKPVPINTFAEWIASERVWIQYWVELPDAASAGAYGDWLRSYIEDQKKLGRFERPVKYALTTIPGLIEEFHLMPEGVKAMSVVSLLFLAVSSLNLVGILLGKFLARIPEVSVRRALGASRAQIFWQHVIEVELVGIAGGVVGILLSTAILRLLGPFHGQRRRAPPGLRDAPRRVLPLRRRRPHRRRLSRMARVLGAAGHAAQGAVMNVGPILRSMRHNRTRVVLVVLEIAITLAIVTNCVNVILAERAKMSVESGFDDDNIVRVLERPFTAEFRDEKFLATIIASDLRTIAAVPGVRAVANTSVQLWEGGGSSTGVKPAGVIKEPVGTQTYHGTKGLMDALGVKIIQGRGFQESDYGRPGESRPAQVTVISKELADDLFPGGDAVGKTIQHAANSNETMGDVLTIVGVMERFFNPWGIGAGNGDLLGPRAMLEPSGVGSYERGIPFLIRTEPGAMASVVAEVEKRLAAANPGASSRCRRPTTRRGAISRRARSR